MIGSDDWILDTAYSGGIVLTDAGFRGAKCDATPNAPFSVPNRDHH